ncbi:MAG: diguanylate cyclase [Candidatus Omnitrophica bacterium]|jgi:diguanylate cyclase (GGDEF)-like protein/PAS domain S-box-containing protein|nr:diguanylate cyclase [Candidatus Omnitrophota bacterium]
MVRKTTCKKTRRQLKSLSDKFVALQASEKHCVEIQESLRCAHQQLLDIIEFFPDAILVIDGNKRVIAWNRELEEMTGIKKKDILGKGEYSYSVPFYGTRRPILIDLITIPNQRIEGTYNYIRREGEVLYAEVFIQSLYGGRGAYLWIKAAPLYDIKGEMAGAIESIRDITLRKKAEKELELLNEELTRSNKELKQMALRDPHTGLYNHRYLIEVLDAEFERSRRYNSPLSLMMIDLDYFRSINDVYGHQFGDKVLRKFAVFLRKTVRQYDIVVRYGGEEFAVLFPGTGRARAIYMAQRLLDDINLQDFGSHKNSIKLKVSVAVASFPEDKVIKSADLIEVTDHMLNKAKECGGNRVYSTLDVSAPKPLPVLNGGGVSRMRILQEKLQKLNKSANQSLIEAIFAFAKTIELKDHYTGTHVERTVHYATSIGSKLRLPREEVLLVRQAAILHDLGKIGVSETILQKSSRLTSLEFEALRRHPKIGADIIRPIRLLHGIIPLILYHHERWDGTGYPFGLKGENIPVGARIIAIADVYQALISNRPYRKAFSKAKALQMIKAGAGSQFDPRIVEAFLDVIREEKKKT